MFENYFRKDYLIVTHTGSAVIRMAIEMLIQGSFLFQEGKKSRLVEQWTSSCAFEEH